jgi:hypothetical protein
MRLIFEFEGNDLRLITQQPVDVPAKVAGVSDARQSGVFVDTHDAAGRTLARVPAPGAFHDSAEVFPEKHGEPIVRAPVDRPRGAFTVIVPTPQDADHVRVVELTPPEPGMALTAARTVAPPPIAPRIRELARFPLQIRR